MKKISVVVASRANYGRIKSVLTAINNSSTLELDLVLAASALLYRFGSIEDTVKADGFTVNHKIYSVIEGESHTSMVKSTAILMSDLATYFASSCPDFVLTVADRHETLATAIAASYLNIPLCHTQGGELTGSIDDKVRHAITKLSNIHFPATALATENVVKMGEDPTYVFHTGCPALDLIHELDLSPSCIEEPEKGSGAQIDFNSDYSVIVYHPVTDNHSEIDPVMQFIFACISQSSHKFIWLWPNVDAGSDKISKSIRARRDSDIDFASKVRFVRTFSPEDYLRVLYNSNFVIGNSSSFIRECSVLAIPALIIGERQRSRELADNAVTVSINELSYRSPLEIVASLPSKDSLSSSGLYSYCNAGLKISQILDSLSVDVRKKPLYS